MSDDLATYLTDHMAGSVAALEVLERLADSRGDEPVGAEAARLRDEILGERRILDGLAERLGVAMSLPRKAASWVAEKAVQVKLRYDDPGDGAFRLLESLEGLSLGIEGKRLLWKSLSNASSSRDDLKGPDYDGLIAAAEDQRRRVEVHRLAAARDALAATTPTP